MISPDCWLDPPSDPALDIQKKAQIIIANRRAYIIIAETEESNPVETNREAWAQTETHPGWNLDEVPS